VTRGAPASLSGLTVPVRTLRAAATVVCQECHSVVPTRDGAIAGHYAAGTTLCSASSTPVPPTRGAA
jgi:hypothetical protein